MIKRNSEMPPLTPGHPRPGCQHHIPIPALRIPEKFPENPADPPPKKNTADATENSSAVLKREGPVSGKHLFSVVIGKRKKTELNGKNCQYSRTQERETRPAAVYQDNGWARGTERCLIRKTASSGPQASAVPGPALFLSHKNALRRGG